MESIRAVMEVNFVAPYPGMLTVLPGMRLRRFGVIANMSSDEHEGSGTGCRGLRGKQGGTVLGNREPVL